MGHTSRSKVIYVEVSAFSECFLFYFVFRACIGPESLNPNRSMTDTQIFYCSTRVLSRFFLPITFEIGTKHPIQHRIHFNYFLKLLIVCNLSIDFLNASKPRVLITCVKSTLILKYYLLFIEVEGGIDIYGSVESGARD